MNNDGYYQQEASDEYEREQAVRDESRQDHGDYFKDRLADVRAQADLARTARISAWRVAHPEATCSDATVLALMDIEAIGQRGEQR